MGIRCHPDFSDLLSAVSGVWPLTRPVFSLFSKARRSRAWAGGMTKRSGKRCRTKC